MPQGTLKVSRKGKKREPYVVLHYKSADGKHRQKSLGRATEADILAIGEGVQVEFGWSENGKAEVADWPLSYGKQDEEATKPDQEDCATAQSKPVDEAQTYDDQAEKTEGNSQEEEAYGEALELAARRMMALSPSFRPM